MSKAELNSNPLIKKLLDASVTKRASLITESKYLNNIDFTTTSVPAINVALSGELDGGLTAGLLQIAGPSAHFKTLMLLICAKAYMDKYPDAILYFYDTEFGSPLSYFDSIGIDRDRTIHAPVTDVEELKQDISKLLESIDRNDKVFIALDSIGNLASRKEVEDALDGKTVADMTRAKQLKSLFRIITPHLKMKDIPMGVVNHTYKEIGLFPKDIVGGGTGSYYSSNDIWIIGKQQEKTGKDITGYHFIINIEKSRFVKAKSKIPVTVTFDGGIYKYSGLLEMALESGQIIKPSNGWYQLKDDDKKYREKDTHDILKQLLNNEEFKIFVKNKYKLSAKNKLMNDGEIMDGMEED